MVSKYRYRVLKMDQCLGTENRATLYHDRRMVVSRCGPKGRRNVWERQSKRMIADTALNILTWPFFSSHTRLFLTRSEICAGVKASANGRYMEKMLRNMCRRSARIVSYRILLAWRCVVLAGISHKSTTNASNFSHRSAFDSSSGLNHLQRSTSKQIDVSGRNAFL